MEPTLATGTEKKDELAVGATQCLNNSGLMIALAIVMVSLMVPVGILAQKIKNLKSGEATSEMTNFESTQSKKQLNIKEMESVEASLKKEAETPQE